jgi:hypothetical protein
MRCWLTGIAAVLLPFGSACAWQSAPRRPTPVLISPPPAVQFQQTVQQQQVRDQLQKSQLQQQLHQGVTDNAKRPSTRDPRSQRQLDQADRAQRQRDRANQQDLLDRERDASRLPRVIPQSRPAPAHSGG